MLSVEECKRYIKKNPYSDEDMKEIRDSFYQLAEISVNEYIQIKENRKKLTGEQIPVNRQNS